MIQQLELFATPTDAPFTPTIGFVFEQNETLVGEQISHEEVARLAG